MADLRPAIRLRVEGLGPARLLEAAQAQKLYPLRVKRLSARVTVFDMAVRDEAAFLSLCEKRGYRVGTPQPMGVWKMAVFLRARWGLALGLVAFMLCVWVLTGIIWFVRVTGDAVYAGEARAYLREQGVGALMWRSAVDAPALEAGLSSRLPEVAWVYVRLRGVSLEVELRSGVPAPDSEVNGTGDLIAARDGVITRVYTLRGTAACKPGDIVRAGDVLIAGQERGAEGTLNAVRARGTVEARVWERAVVRVSRVTCLSEPTGSQCAKDTIITPFFTWGGFNEAPYGAFDRTVTVLPLGGAFAPIWIQRETLTEVKLVYALRSANAVQAEAKDAALQILAARHGGTDETVDKWVDYCMIGDEAVEARVTGEYIMPIAIPAPLHTE